MSATWSGRIGNPSIFNPSSSAVVFGRVANGGIFSTASSNRYPLNSSSPLTDKRSLFRRQPKAQSNVSLFSASSPTDITSKGGPGGNDNSMKDVQIKSLDGVDLAVIHKCWHEAFSDYQLPFQLPLARLRVRFSQVNYNPEFSYGAFDGDKLVGFWLSGYREKNGERFGYNVGTAVVPEWRRRGLSGKLFNAVEDALKKADVSQYILEVFCDNDSAINLYKKNGFVVSRLLHCYRVEAFDTDAAADKTIFSTRGISLSDLKDLYSEFLDYVPNWQNTWSAMASAAESTIPMVVEDDNGVIGYGIFQPISRRISQMGFKKGVDQDTIAALLIQKFYEHVGNSGELEVVHVPDGNSVIHDLLPRLGFRRLTSLYEMKKSL